MKKTKNKPTRRPIYLTISLVVLAALCYLVTPSTNPVSSSVVSVMNRQGTGGGTGFVTRDFAGKHVIVTNDHVCAVALGNHVVVVSDNGTRSIRRVLKRSFIRDLCVVEGIPAPALPIAKTAPNRFEELLVVGHPLLGPTTPSRGVYLGTDIMPVGFNTKEDGSCEAGSELLESFFGEFCIAQMELSMTSIMIYPGNSGSPVVNSSGEVVGVINSGDSRSNYGNYVPLPYLQEILK